MTMLEINLLPLAYRRKPKKALKLPPIPLVRILVSLLVLLFILEGLLFLHGRFTHSRLGSLQGKLEALEPDRLKDVRLEALVSKSQKRMNNLKGILTRPFYWTELLAVISQSVNEGIWLSRLGVALGEKPGTEKDKGAPPATAKSAPPGLKRTAILQISGSVRSTGDETAVVGLFIENLKGQRLFQHLMRDTFLERMDRGRSEEITYFDFNISCVFKDEFIEAISAGERLR